MKVKELIEKLSKCEQDLFIYVNGCDCKGDRIITTISKELRGEYIRTPVIKIYLQPK